MNPPKINLSQFPPLVWRQGACNLLQIGLQLDQVEVEQQLFWVLRNRFLFHTQPIFSQGVGHPWSYPEKKGRDFVSQNPLKIPPMNIGQQLKTLATNLASNPSLAGFQIYAVFGEHGADSVQGKILSQKPVVCVSFIGEELAKGRVVDLSNGRRYFVRVDSPLGVSASMVMANLRTFSLTLSDRFVLSEKAEGTFDKTHMAELAQQAQSISEAVVSIEFESDFLQVEKIIEYNAPGDCRFGYRIHLLTGSVLGHIDPKEQ